MTAMDSAVSALRIGEVAQRAGTTTRTIRYYEEIGLLSSSTERGAGRHRVYTEADVERLQRILRLKDLLGLSLDELRDVIEAEEARGALRAEWRRADLPPHRRREILHEAIGHVDGQLALVGRRREKLDELHRELADRRAQLQARIGELDAADPAPDRDTRPT
jgi:DNA-binding transcriptional MerR regulator